jgi:hypothetical protein
MEEGSRHGDLSHENLIEISHTDFIRAVRAPFGPVEEHNLSLSSEVGSSKCAFQPLDEDSQLPATSVLRLSRTSPSISLIESIRHIRLSYRSTRTTFQTVDDLKNQGD